MTPIQLNTLQKFFALGIRNLLIGGQAMRARGIDRQTHDLDLWIARDSENAARMLRFLRRVQNIPPLERLQQPNFKFTVGNPGDPEVDILTSVAGDPDFESCYARSQQLQLDNQTVRVAATIDLLAIKEAAAKLMDIDAMNSDLSGRDRNAALHTAAKERKDIVKLTLLFGAGG